MKHYAFTVTRHSDQFTRIEDISYLSYNAFWQIIEDFSLILIYKVEHLGGNDKHCNHKHYHGVIYGNVNFVELTDKTKDYYSVRFEVLNEPQQWFNYCLHELSEQVSSLTKSNQEIYGELQYNLLMNLERPRCPKPQKILPLLTIEIIGNI